MIDLERYNFADPEDVKKCLVDLLEEVNNSQSNASSLPYFDKDISADDLTRIKQGESLVDGKNKRIVVNIGGELHVTSELTPLPKN